MAQKYSIIYNDVVNVEHELQIYDDDYASSVIDILGRVYLDYSRADDHLEAIRGQGLRVELEADADLTFSDLYSEEEKTFLVIYIRDSVTLFKGWLNPEGWHEDFVKENWIVSFDCVDGLGYLENLSFVETDGTPITGRISQLDALQKALIRTGTEKDINVDINIFYTGLANTVSVLENVYINAERYIKDDGYTYMSCEEVIRDILEPYGAVLVSYKLGWYIIKPNQLYSNTTATYFNYDYLGVAGSAFGQDYTNYLGSHINNWYPHHCNENQSFSIAPSLGAYRISYKYGLVQSLLENTRLISDDGYTIDGWIIPEADSGTTDGTTTSKLVDSTQNFVTTVAIGDLVHNTTDDTYAVVTAVDSNTTLSLDADIMVSGETYDIQTARNMTIPFPTGTGTVTIDAVTTGNEIEQLQVADYVTLTTTASINVHLNYTYTYGGGTMNFFYQIYISDAILPDGGANIYYLQDDDTWGSVGVPHSLKSVKASYNLDILLNHTTPEKPMGGTGYLYVSIITPVRATGGDITLNEVRMSPEEESIGIDGEFHTFQRITKPSAQIKEIKEVATGDNISDLYLGTIYKADTTTPTETWYRDGITEAKAILRIMGEEQMRMNQLPTRIFSGDVYGYMPYMNVVTIDGQDGAFMFLDYSYDTKENVISMVMRQILGDELDDQTDDRFYRLTLDDGNTVNPTIVG